MTTPRFLTLSAMILIIALSRIIPHPPNFTPVIAVALFGGAYFTSKKASYGVPLIAMILSDLVLSVLYGYGFFTSMRLVVYGCFAVITTMGFLLRSRTKASWVLGTSLAGSLFFFLVTNFAHWLGSGMYPLDAAGLATCYVAAIPFFRNMVVSSILYTALLFGGFELAKLKFTNLAVKHL